MNAYNKCSVYVVLEIRQTSKSTIGLIIINVLVYIYTKTLGEFSLSWRVFVWGRGRRVMIGKEYTLVGWFEVIPSHWIILPSLVFLCHGEKIPYSMDNI